MKYLKILALAGPLLMLSPQAVAHHSWASIFDADGDIEIEGVVTKVLWRNPHVQFQVTTDQGAPAETVWTIESNAVARLTRMGVDEDVLPLGARVKVAGFPSLTGANEIFVNHLLLPDQTEVIIVEDGRTPMTGRSHRFPPTRSRTVWLRRCFQAPELHLGSWHVIYGAEGSHGAGRIRGNDWTDHALAFRAEQEAAGLGGRPHRHDCSPRQALSIFGEPYPMALVDLGDTIEIRLEFLDTYRTVHMDPGKPIPAEVPKDHLGAFKGPCCAIPGRENDH